MSDTGQTGIGLPARRFFDEIVGLRIFLACWVALQHAMQSAGYQRSNPLFSFMVAGDVAVEIFIIISGFVITGLILNKREDYIILTSSDDSSASIRCTLLDWLQASP